MSPVKWSLGFPGLASFVGRFLHHSLRLKYQNYENKYVSFQSYTLNTKFQVLFSCYYVFIKSLYHEKQFFSSVHVEAKLLTNIRVLRSDDEQEVCYVT